MNKCECVGGCPFFNDVMPDSSGLGAIMKNKYCLGNKTKCARYMVFTKKGKPAVPANLYPNMIEKAKQIIAGG
jgi:hypothetical protein